MLPEETHNTLNTFELVVWKDTSSYDEWSTPAEAESLSPITVVTVGSVVKETKEFLTIAGSTGIDPETGDVILRGATWSIPKKMVIARETLEIA